MSIFTIAIIIWVIYQLGISLLKKGQQLPGAEKPSDPLKMSDARSVRETLPGPSKPQGSWLEQIQQAMKDTARQMEERSVPEESLESTRPRSVMVDYVQTEGTQGTEGTSSYEGSYRSDADSSIDGNPIESVPRVSEAMTGNSYFMTKKELTQGIVWAEVLGKPRALHPFRGPR